MPKNPKDTEPVKKGWDKALTTNNAQLVFDSYKNHAKGVILMSEVDWAVAIGLELDPNIVSFRYVRDPYRPARQSAPRWRFIVKPRTGCTYCVEVLERNRRRGDKKYSHRRQQTVYIDDLQPPEIVLSNADACSYLTSAWDHETIALENKIFGVLQDKVVRTLRELFEKIGGNHPIFVAALLRQYLSGSIDTNLAHQPLGWLTHVAAFGVLNHE